MTNSTLVAYATKHGATLDIANAIADELTGAGLAVEVLPVDQVEDPSRYDAIVLGSAMYVGQWRPEAVRFVETYADELAHHPVWIFSSGPTGEGDPVELLQGVRLPAKVEPLVARIKPRDIVVFHGELDPEKLGLAEKLMIRGVKAPTGDFRDWDSIRAWASTIAESLRQVTS